MRWVLAVLVVASIVVGATTSRAAAAGPLPDCAPGTPAPAPPTAAVTGNPATPDRIVAGRFFTIVEAGQLLAPGIGVGEGPLDRAPRLDPLPRQGVNTGGPPVLGRVCSRPAGASTRGCPSPRSFARTNAACAARRQILADPRASRCATSVRPAR